MQWEGEGKRRDVREGRREKREEKSEEREGRRVKEQA